MKKTMILWMILLSTVSYGLVTETIGEGEDLVVSLINQEPDPVAPGNVMDIRFRIENRGAEPAENVQVKIIEKFPFSIYQEEVERSIGTIAGRQKDEIGVREKFKILVDDNAVDGEFPIEFWYKINNNVWVKAGDYLIDIRSRDAVLAINQVTTKPAHISPGGITKVSFRLDNLATSTLKDVKLQLQVFTPLVTTTSITFNELPFTPIGSGDEKTIDKIEPKKSEEIVFDLFTDADAASKVYKVPYTLTYEDDSGHNFSRSGVVGLLVDAQPDVSITLDETDIFSAGAKGTITVKFVNKGFSDVKFVNVRLKETDNYDILSNQEVYIGNIDSDDFEDADFDLLISDSASGEVSLPLSVEYRSANGELSNLDVPLKLNLYKGSELKKRAGNGGNGVVGFIIILVVVGVGIFLYRRYKKKKKR